MIRLDKELEAYGYSKGPDEFRDLLINVFTAMFPTHTDEDVLCDEHAPSRFVWAIRSSIGINDMPHVLILRTLLNVRKKGGLH